VSHKRAAFIIGIWQRPVLVGAHVALMPENFAQLLPAINNRWLFNALSHARARVTFSYLAKMPRGHKRREKSRVDALSCENQHVRAWFIYRPASPRFPDSTFGEDLSPEAL